MVYSCVFQEPALRENLTDPLISVGFDQTRIAFRVGRSRPDPIGRQ